MVKTLLLTSLLVLTLVFSVIGLISQKPIATPMSSKAEPSVAFVPIGGIGVGQPCVPGSAAGDNGIAYKCPNGKMEVDLEITQAARPATSGDIKSVGTKLGEDINKLSKDVLGLIRKQDENTRELAKQLIELDNRVQELKLRVDSIEQEYALEKQK